MSLDVLVHFSNAYGKDPAFVLAGGGNTSYKTADELYIKGSGTSLATITADGFVKMNRHALSAIWGKTYPADTDAREAAVLADMMAAKCLGEEAKRQLMEVEHRLPDAVVACVGGGSNAIGIFTDFIKEKDVRLIGVEPGGLGIETGEHGAPLGHGQEGIFFGARSFNMQTPDGQIKESYSISAGLDFPSVGPEHAYLQSIGRAQYVNATDEEPLLAFRDLCLHEGIIPALESSHALAHALRMIRENPDKEQIILCNLSGRGDKDVNQVLDRFERIGLFKDGHMNREAYINATTL